MSVFTSRTYVKPICVTRTEIVWLMYETEYWNLSWKANGLALIVKIKCALESPSEDRSWHAQVAQWLSFIPPLY